MNAPAKGKRGVRTALKAAELTGAYHLLHLLQAPFGFVFWLIEQRKARLQDRIANDRHDNR
jgi:hypothetical protein